MTIEEKVGARRKLRKECRTSRRRASHMREVYDTRAALTERSRLTILTWRIDMPKPPLVFTYYIAAPAEKVWDGFVSKEANQKIFAGADFEVDLRPGGAMTWSGPGRDGKSMRYVTGEVLRVERVNLWE